jgi:hypothetical protein
MSGSLNLRPYGDSWANTGAAGPALGSMEDRAIFRARQKLELVRSGKLGDKPIGPDLVQLIPGAVLALLIGGPALIGAIALFGSRDGKVGGLVLLIFAVLIFLIPVLLFVQSRPSTPKRALQGFYRSVGRGRYGRARSLTVHADLDDFPRYQPVIDKLGTPSGHPRNFGNELAFKDYWRELVRSQPWPYCLSYVKRVQETPIREDVVLVDFELKLIMNTSLWLLLLPVGLLIVVIVDMATRKHVSVPMRKVLVRVGQEWHIFSAEWQGYEEFNTAWLREI